MYPTNFADALIIHRAQPNSQIFHMHNFVVWMGI